MNDENTVGREAGIPQDDEANQENQEDQNQGQEQVNLSLPVLFGLGMKNGVVKRF